MLEFNFVGLNMNYREVFLCIVISRTAGINYSIWLDKVQRGQLLQLTSNLSFFCKDSSSLMF